MTGKTCQTSSLRSQPAGEPRDRAMGAMEWWNYGFKGNKTESTYSYLIFRFYWRILSFEL